MTQNPIFIPSTATSAAADRKNRLLRRTSDVVRIATVLGGLFVAVCAGRAAETPRPNIVIIYADDLGYGDVGCYGAKRVATPNIDRLAREGLLFTSAYATSATCTPSRFALLSGEYPWRRDGTGILPGDAALVVDLGRATLPSLLRSAGYTTGAVGKWHFGLGAWRRPDGVMCELSTGLNADATMK